MKKKLIIYISALFLSLEAMLTGCSHRNVTTTNYARSDLRNYKTFAWLPPGDTLQNDLAQQEVIGEDIRNKLNHEMREEGYILDPQNPDLLVLVHTKFKNRIALETFSSGYYYYTPGFYVGTWYDYYYPNYSSFGYVYGPRYIAPVNYTEGTIIIDLVDAKTKQVIWRGVGSEEEYTGAEARDEILDNIDDIFDEFPG